MSRVGVKHRARDGASAHSLRHRRASDVYERCRDPRVVQEMLWPAVVHDDAAVPAAGLDQMREAMEGRRYVGGGVMPAA